MAMTPEVKKRIADAQKARWAAKRAGITGGERAPAPFKEIAEKIRASMSTPQAPPPPNLTVIAFQQQLVPLVEKREIVQQHVRQAQRQLQEAQMALQEHQQALQDTENAIQYRLNMIGQLTGQPVQAPMPTMAHISEVAMYPSGNAFAAQQSRPQLMDPYAAMPPSSRIDGIITSIPAPQNARYASGYVPTGEGNPRSESAVDVREDPQTREVMVAMAKARAAV